MSLGAVLQALGATSSHIGPTNDCILVGLKTYCAASILAIAFYDTTVLLAISAQLLINSVADGWRARFRAFVRGKGMGQISGVLLRTGQQYYL